MSGTRARNRRLLSILAATVLGLVALAGCGSSGSGSSAGSTTAQSAGSSSAAAASAATITIKDFAFSTPASVSPGAKVTVDNRDDTAHTVTADSGHTFDDSAATGKSTFTAPTTPGSYPFHCSIHPEMHGTLVVK
jgi:plastocyanin